MGQFQEKLGEKRIFTVMTHIMPKTGIFRLHICHRHYGSIYS